MDFELTEERSMLRTMARDFLAARCPRKLVREMVEDEKGHPAELWKEMAGLGWMGLAVPEEYGGAGGSLLDLATLIEEMGRACMPGPFFSTVVLGGLSLLEAGTEKLRRQFLPELVRGGLLLTVALTESAGVYAADAMRTKAISDGKGGFAIRGMKLFVPDAHLADYIICAARTRDAAKAEHGITLFLVERRSPGVNCSVLRTIAGDKLCEVVLDNAEVSEDGILGQLDEGWHHAQAIVEKATAMRCAEMLGGARQVLEMTVAFARDRAQFGHPIGSFQIIQHVLADMFTGIEACSLVTYDAIWRLSSGVPASREISMAKALVSEAFNKAALSSHQIHGAVGFTDDHDLPLYFKRAKSWELSLGDAHFHLDKVAAQAGI
ncbi:MAG: acyl-CoA/acyl-ACP dehydrogenase [Dehalococcoidia bacterium]|nr:acyl-CoA/acyl-ACP dehydrogenase [Dehalococcoidia bacterium]